MSESQEKINNIFLEILSNDCIIRVKNKHTKVCTLFYIRRRTEQKKIIDVYCNYSNSLLYTLLITLKNWNKFSNVFYKNLEDLDNYDIIGFVSCKEIDFVKTIILDYYHRKTNTILLDNFEKVKRCNIILMKKFEYSHFKTFTNNTFQRIGFIKTFFINKYTNDDKNKIMDDNDLPQQRRKKLKNFIRNETDIHDKNRKSKFGKNTTHSSKSKKFNIIKK